MLKQLTVKSFTTFDDITFDFAKGINVLIGDNGTGKSHLLKLAYALSFASHAASREKTTKATLQKALANKLVNVFQPDSLGRLVRSHRARGSRGGRSKAEIALSFDSADSLQFTFSNVAEVEVALVEMPRKFLESEPIFIPTKEVISTFPGFAALYRNREIAFDETYFDLCEALAAPPLRGPRLTEVTELLEPVQKRLGGTVVREGDQFYLDSEAGKTEMPLVAEGIRKLATIAHLLRNGALRKRGMVFWDEPESNLNPRLVRDVAKILWQLANQGVQIFVGTHSFFLMKELEMLRQQEGQGRGVPFRFITLGTDNEGEPVFEQGGSMKDISNIVALDAELEQYDRELKGSNAA